MTTLTPAANPGDIPGGAGHGVARGTKTSKVGITANISIHPAATQVTSLEALGKALFVEVPITEEHPSELVQYRFLQDQARQNY